MTPNITTRNALKKIKNKAKQDTMRDSSGKTARSGKKRGPRVKKNKIIDGTEHKICTGIHGCNQWLPLDKFYSRGSRHHTSCAECTRKSKAAGYDLVDPKGQTDKPDPKAFWEMGCWKKIGRHNLLYRWTGDDWVRCSDGTRFFHVPSALLP
jgi:hypothetical protein